jgi:hypothetical protein
MKQDVVKALKAMLAGTVAFFLEFGKYVLAVVAIFGTGWCLAQIAINWPMQCGAVIIIFALGLWFLMELDTARWEREQTEKDISNGSKN